MVDNLKNLEFSFLQSRVKLQSTYFFIFYKSWGRRQGQYPRVFMDAIASVMLVFIRWVRLAHFLSPCITDQWNPSYSLFCKNLVGVFVPSHCSAAENRNYETSKPEKQKRGRYISLFHKILKSLHLQVKRQYMKQQ